MGYHINAQGFKPPENRVSAILEYQQPPTIFDFRRFNGIFNYYRASIANAAQLQAPLTDLLRGSIKRKDKRSIKWTSQLSEAFVRCKNSIAHAVRTSSLDLDAPIALLTDANAQRERHFRCLDARGHHVEPRACNFIAHTPVSNHRWIQAPLRHLHRTGAPVHPARPSEGSLQCHPLASASQRPRHCQGSEGKIRLARTQKRRTEVGTGVH